MKVIISCSGKFHAFALAEQMERFGMLETLFTSYSSIKNPLAQYLVSRRDKEKISKSLVATNLVVAFGLKLYNNPFFWNDLFDRWVSYKIRKSDATVFIGWSSMNLRSIQAAKKKGMLTIVERGSSHIQFQNEILAEEYRRFGIDFHIDKRTIEKELKEYNNADYISLPSGFVQKTFRDKGFYEQKLLLNNYGTSSTFSKVEPYKIIDKFVILYVGTSNIRKGLIYLYEALEALNIPSENYEMRFVGKIDSELTNQVAKYRKNNWEFIGQVNHYDLPKYISECSVAIHPSLEEGLSMVIPQIMSCGVPVIASTNSGGEDLIIENKSGFIVPVRNAKAIAQKIELLYQNRDTVIEMKDYLSTNPLDLSWDAYGERYLDNIKKALK